MPERGVALEKLGFLTIGLFDGQDPGPGHRYTLDANIFTTVEDCSLHGCCHQDPPTLLRPRAQAPA